MEDNQAKSTDKTSGSGRLSQRTWMIVAAVLLLVVCGLGYMLYQKSSELGNVQADLAAYDEQDDKKSAPKATSEPIEQTETVEIERSSEANDENANFVAPAGQNISEKAAVIEIVYDSKLVFDEFHLEYGTDFTNLNQKTDPESQKIGLGGNEEPVRPYSVRISGDKLEPGLQYFYRIVGTTSDGETVKSDTAAFTNVK